MARNLRIHGRVQGVGFRYLLAREAERLGVKGWVRNRRDGSVEALLDGAPVQVDALIAWARIGPPAARVERVEVSEQPERDGGTRYDAFVALPSE